MQNKGLILQKNCIFKKKYLTLPKKLTKYEPLIQKIEIYK